MSDRSKRILMIFTLVPFPLRKHGVSIRYLPIIEHLSKRHDLDLIVVNSTTEEEDISALERYCRSVKVVPDTRHSRHGISSRLSTYLAFLFPWTPPLSFVAHRGARITRGIVEETKNKRYDVVIWVGSYLVPNVISGLPSYLTDRVFVDFIDSPTLVRKRRKERQFSLEILERYERWKTQSWETKVIRKALGTIYISEVDAGTVPAESTPGKTRYVIPNGIHTGSYTRERNSGMPSPAIGFFGNMGYPPNVEAALWLYHEVFVPLRRRRRDLSMVIIGRAPVPSIVQLGEKPGVVVTGTVDDIWSHVNAIDIFVFPLWTGAGLKNKILEAMYAGRPVITSPIGHEGIDAVPGRDLLICKRSEEFQEEILRLLESPAEADRLGKSGHSFVAETYSWPQILRVYEDLIMGKIGLNSRVPSFGKGA